MPFNARSSTNFQDEAYQFIKGSEDFGDRVYGDPLGIPTVGAGYALAVKDRNDVWSLKSTLVADFASIGITLTSGQLFTLNSVVRALNSGNARRAQALSNTLGNQVGSDDIRPIIPAEGRALFNLELQRALDAVKARFRKFLGGANGDSLFTRLQGSKEVAAKLWNRIRMGARDEPASRDCRSPSWNVISALLSCAVLVVQGSGL